MSSELQKLQNITACPSKTVKPFESWKGSPIQDWTVTIQLVNMGDLADIAKAARDVSPMEAVYLSRIYLLAKCLKSINGTPVITEEDVEEYNRQHDLSGANRIDAFKLKILFIKQMSEAVITRLAFMHDQIQDEYVAGLLGRPLPDELSITKMSEGKFKTDLKDVKEPEEKLKKTEEKDSNEDNKDTDESKDIQADI